MRLGGLRWSAAVVASAFEVLHAGALMVDKGIVAAGADEGELGSWDATA